MPSISLIVIVSTTIASVVQHTNSHEHHCFSCACAPPVSCRHRRSCENLQRWTSCSPYSRLDLPTALVGTHGCSSVDSARETRHPWPTLNLSTTSSRCRLHHSSDHLHSPSSLQHTRKLPWYLNTKLIYMEFGRSESAVKSPARPKVVVKVRRIRVHTYCTESCGFIRTNCRHRHPPRREVGGNTTLVADRQTRGRDRVPSRYDTPLSQTLHQLRQRGAAAKSVARTPA